MKNLPSKYKWPLLVLINALPFVLNVIFYPVGAIAGLCMFPCVFIGLTALNYVSLHKTAHYVLMQAYLLVCLVCSGYASTYLYYHNISSDPMTPAVGYLLVFWGTLIIVITTIITGCIKRKQRVN